MIVARLGPETVIGTETLLQGISDLRYEVEVGEVFSQSKQNMIHYYRF